MITISWGFSVNEMTTYNSNSKIFEGRDGMCPWRAG
jgi:hypothetical protein